MTYEEGKFKISWLVATININEFYPVFHSSSRRETTAFPIFSTPCSKTLLLRWHAARLMGSEKRVKEGPNITLQPTL